MDETLFNNTIVPNCTKFFIQVFFNIFLPAQLFFLWPYTEVLHDVSWALRNNELIKKQRACIYNSFCDQCVGVIGSTGPEANIQRAIQDNGSVNERYITFAPSILRHKAPVVTQLWVSGQHHNPKRDLKRKLSSVSWLTLKCPPLYCKTFILYSEAKGADQKEIKEEIFYRDLIVIDSHYETKGCDTTGQRTGRLIRRLLLIPVRLCPSVPWGRKMEEVIDSSHNNLWEGQTLPFPFSGDKGYYSKILKGPHKGYFCVSVIARH